MNTATKRKPIEVDLCQCGCGRTTKLASKTNSKKGWVKGQPLAYLQGHGGRWQKAWTLRECAHCHRFVQIARRGRFTSRNFVSHSQIAGFCGVSQ